MSEPALELSGVTVDFDGLRAIDHVDLVVEAGSRHVVIGPNGAGKTTLFGVIGGQIAATEGRVSMFGRDVMRMRPYQRARLGLRRSFQLTQLFPTLTVAENVAAAHVGASGRRNVVWRRALAWEELRDQVSRTLGRWNLSHLAELPVAELPYGRRRVLELALATASDARILLLDEPTAGLETLEIDEVIELLDRLPDETTVVMIEHDMRVAFRVARHVTVMDRGRVLVTGPQEAVRRDQRVVDVYLGGEPDADG